jgi:hypothetical protein
MVMTILEAPVLPQNVTLLKSAYAAAIQHLETGIVETFLVSDAKNPALWRIMTVWKDRQALDAMRGSGQTPRGVLIFREAAAEPSLSVLDVAAHAAV